MISPSNILKSKIFYFSLIVLLSSIFFNHYALNVDYDVDYDWSNEGKLPPAPIVNSILWVKRTLMMIPNHIFPPNVMVINSMFEHMTYQALRLVSELEVADLIKQNGGKLSVKELSILTNTNEENLGRLLRAISTNGLFYHHGNGVYSNNRLSSVLRKDHPNSVKDFVEMGDGYKAAAHLDQALKYPNGWDDMGVNNKENELVTPWEKALGARAWKFYDLPENKNKREKFDKAMVSLNKMIGDGIFIDYDWGLTENSTVVDIGGGYGGVLSELLKRFKTKGIIYDLPEIIENTRKVWNEKQKEFLDRVVFFPGNFFKDPPPRADAYVLRFILHDWSDTSSVKILKNLRSSISSSDSSPITKLIIIEMLLDEPIRDTWMTQMDLAMLCFDLGKERTSQDFIKIINKSGWKYTRHVNCRGTISIIEAVPDFNYIN